MAFQKLDYRGQLKVLNKMAHEAIKAFPISVKNIEFINHGENATFRVIDKSGNQHLLRLHRTNYHTKKAILEELDWLRHLNKSKTIKCQMPLASNSGDLLVSVTKDEHSRYCDILDWKSGAIRRSNHSVESFFQLGYLTALLHEDAPKRTTHRQYWTADGLLGEQATFGSPFDLKNGISNYCDYIQCRDMAHKSLNSFAREFPQKMGMIHADLHFGNIVWSEGEAIPIDFDDCGFGFFMYDLAGTFVSAESVFSSVKGNEKLVAFLMGYQSVRSLDATDMELVQWLVLARRIGVLSWLYHRSDNPRLVWFFHRMVKKTTPIFKQVLKSGPRFDWLPL